MTQPSPRVSVITIFFNEERFIREAVDSVLAQDFQDFELLLVDDGSTDLSSEIARDYAAADPSRIRYLQHPGHSNRGMSATRNLGVREARGKYVAFIDADDRWRPCKLTEQVALLDEKDDVDAVGGSVNYWASHNRGGDRTIQTAHVRDRRIVPGEASLNLYPLGSANAPSMSDLLFRKASIAKVGGFDEAFRGAYEDQAFLAKFYLRSALYFRDRTWSDYRLHPRSCMALLHQEGKYRETRRKFLDWFSRYLSASEDSYPDIQRAVNDAIKRTERRGLREKLAKSPVGSVIRAGKTGLRQLRPLLAPGPAILMYHRIARERFDPWGLAVAPENFADQVRWITDNRDPLPLREFVRRWQTGRLSADAVALTFDDGYACNAKVAAPLLRKHRVPATIFLPADLIRLGREFWWDELERIVLDHQHDVISLNGEVVQLGAQRSGDRDWLPDGPRATQRQAAYKAIWARLHDLPNPALDASMEQLRNQARVGEIPRETHRPLSAAEVREIQSGLLEFGSHGLSHSSLPLLSTAERAREIEESMERCAELTGVRPVCFAYPYGDLDLESRNLVEQAGYDFACKAAGAFVGRRDDLFALPRLQIGDWDSAALARKLGRRPKGFRPISRAA